MGDKGDVIRCVVGDDIAVDTVVVGVVAMVVVVGGIVHIFSEWYLLVGSVVCAIVVEVVVDVTANGVVIMGVVVPKSLVNQVVK